MNEKLAILFDRIKSNSSYLTVNEAQTSNGIIMPILNSLSWDVFDTLEVTPEYTVAGRRVDFALRLQDQNKVFLEIKKTSEDLEKHHEQLVYYAFQQGVKLAILTNGVTWQFYLPLEEGNWEQRKFFTIDLLEQSNEAAISRFESLLLKTNVENGVSYHYAKSLYEGKQRNKIIKENIPKAWHKLISEPDEMLVDLLNETLEKVCGYKAEDEQIVVFLRGIVAGTVVPAEFKKKAEKGIKTAGSEGSSEPKDVTKLNLEFLTNLAFTKIIEGRFAGMTASGWRGLINLGLKLAVERGIGFESLKTELEANLKEGNFNENGYSPVPETNISFQGQDANGTANNALKLAKILNCELYVLFEWGPKGKFPHKKGLVHWKP
jgi:predicted type IV restriction endonuclease